MNDELPGSAGLRLQIALAITTGVLVISATAGTAIFLGMPSNPPPLLVDGGFGDDLPSRIPTPSASPSPATEATPSPSPSPSTKAPTVKTPTTTKPAVVLVSLKCDRAELSIPEQTSCTATLSGPAHRETKVSLEADTSDISLPSMVVIAAGASSASFVAEAVAGSGAPTTISARLGEAVKTATVTASAPDATP